jgi:hypothetical protein
MDFFRLEKSFAAIAYMEAKDFFLRWFAASWKRSIAET